MPIRTNVRDNKTPYANYALIAVNIIIFLLSYHPRTMIISGQRVVMELRPWVEMFQLNPAEPFLWQFVTYAFLHGGIAHLLGNMFFLYLFGGNVNNKLGHLGYLCFYLAGAVFSGFGHSVLHDLPIPLVGASGAIAAVTAAYLVLFPQTLITIFYWVIFIGTTEVPAMYFIGFKMIFWDNMIERSTHNVAYDAHLSGYFFGIGVILFLLSTGLVSRSSFDLWSMIKRWNQRRAYRGVVSDGYNPFKGTKTVKVKEHKISPQQKRAMEKIQHIRSQISQMISSGNLASASEKYIELIGLDDKQVLAKQNQLDIANQLMSQGAWQQSAGAYEKFLGTYEKYEYREQVQLMLGILYSRYLDNAELAVKYLELAKKKLSDPSQLDMCKAEISKFG